MLDLRRRCIQTDPFLLKLFSQQREMRARLCDPSVSSRDLGPAEGENEGIKPYIQVKGGGAGQATKYTSQLGASLLAR